MTGGSGGKLVLDLIQCRLLATVESIGHRSGPETPRDTYPGPMDLLERIIIDPAVRFCKPCARGTRLTVGNVLGTLASGCGEAELLADFPQLCHEDVTACLAIGTGSNAVTAD